MEDSSVGAVGDGNGSSSVAIKIGLLAVENNHSVMVDVTLCRVSNVSCPTSEAWSLLNKK
jgi:hypothetical protein